MTTLMNERVQMGGKQPNRGEGVIAPLLDAWRRRPGSAADRDELMRLYVEAEVHRLTNIRAAQLRTLLQRLKDGASPELAANEFTGNGGQ